MKNLSIDSLKISIYDDPVDMGRAAAEFVKQKINDAILERGLANVILATGASQFSFLESLKKEAIDWKKVTVFHLDEYKDLPDTHPASFRKYLKDRILDEVEPRQVFFLKGDAVDINVEMEAYAAALSSHPIDIACIGIGENGHIAFNDPPVADFDDPKLVKLVELDKACRNQQLGEGWFSTFEDVPRYALTLTIPAIMKSNTISCVVPDKRKAEAVHKSLYGEITTDCPASILRNHPDAALFLDTYSSDGIKDE